MCGIFGFALAKRASLIEVFRLLEKLEVHQYPNETKPVGGYGAGMAVLMDNGNLVFEKVGKISDSPARSLSNLVKVDEATFLVGHVRMPSPQFMKTARFRETAQPYVAKCYSDLTVISVHNGNVINYKEIRMKLDKMHTFESEKVELIDSEVIPHFFEELLLKKANSAEALDALFTALEGPNAISLLQIEKDHLLLHIIHKGRIRGLTVWTNSQKEVVFCSRKEPLIEVFSHMLEMGKFKEEAFIPYNEDVNLKLSFQLRV